VQKSHFLYLHSGAQNDPHFYFILKLQVYHRQSLNTAGKCTASQDSVKGNVSDMLLPRGSIGPVTKAAGKRKWTVQQRVKKDLFLAKMKSLAAM
jgi:hypothetical protein